MSSGCNGHLLPSFYLTLGEACGIEPLNSCGPTAASRQCATLWSSGLTEEATARDGCSQQT